MMGKNRAISAAVVNPECDGWREACLVSAWAHLPARPSLVLRLPALQGALIRQQRHCLCVYSGTRAARTPLARSPSRLKEGAQPGGAQHARWGLWRLTMPRRPAAAAAWLLAVALLGAATAVVAGGAASADGRQRDLIGWSEEGRAGSKGVHALGTEFADPDTRNAQAVAAPATRPRGLKVGAFCRGGQHGVSLCSPVDCFVAGHDREWRPHAMSAEPVGTQRCRLLPAACCLLPAAITAGAVVGAPHLSLPAAALRWCAPLLAAAKRCRAAA
jgi:hypothetical protein